MYLTNPKEGYHQPFNGAIREAYPGRLVSLWDMLILNSEKFLHVIGNLHRLQVLLWDSSKTGSLNAASSGLRKDADETISLLSDLDLPLSLVTARRLKKFFEEEKINCVSAREICSELTNRIHDEIGLRSLFVLSPQETKLLTETEPYGPVVTAKFFDARGDLEEAAKCLAFERGTACVMHLVRAVEIALHTLAMSLNAKFKASDDWDAILKEIDNIVNPWPTTTMAEITRKDKYRAIHSNLTSVKRAWRHPSAHARFNATPEIARDIFAAVKGFMVQMTEVA
jgi:hypothetical protein